MAPFLRDTLLATSVMGGWIFTSAVILPACGLQSCFTGRCMPLPPPHNSVQQLSPATTCKECSLTNTALDTDAASEAASITRQDADSH